MNKLPCLAVPYQFNKDHILLDFSLCLLLYVNCSSVNRYGRVRYSFLLPVRGTCLTIYKDFKKKKLGNFCQKNNRYRTYVVRPVPILLNREFVYGL